jgi:hypothetical protein
MWLRTDEGWVHGAYVQPVKNEINSPVLEIPAKGLLLEVTVPFTQSYHDDKGSWKRGYRFYYKSTHWAHQVFTGVNGIVWYKLLDDRNGGYYFAEAQHFRPLNQRINPFAWRPEADRSRFDTPICDCL